MLPEGVCAMIAEQAFNHDERATALAARVRWLQSGVEICVEKQKKARKLIEGDYPLWPSWLHNLPVIAAEDNKRVEGRKSDMLEALGEAAKSLAKAEGARCHPDLARRMPFIPCMGL